VGDCITWMYCQVCQYGDLLIDTEPLSLFQSGSKRKVEDDAIGRSRSRIRRRSGPPKVSSSVGCEVDSCWLPSDNMKWMTSL